LAEDAEGEGPNIDASVFLRDLMLPAYGVTKRKHGDQSINRSPCETPVQHTLQRQVLIDANIPTATL
jgi:hypothetical protein